MFLTNIFNLLSWNVGCNSRYLTQRTAALTRFTIADFSVVRDGLGIGYMVLYLMS